MLQFYLYVNAATKRISHRCRPHYRSCSRCCPRFHPRPSRPHSLLSPSLSPVTVALTCHCRPRFRTRSSLSPSLLPSPVVLDHRPRFRHRSSRSPSLSPLLSPIAVAHRYCPRHCPRCHLLLSPSPIAVALARRCRPRCCPCHCPCCHPLMSPVAVALCCCLLRERETEKEIDNNETTISAMQQSTEELEMAERKRQRGS